MSLRQGQPDGRDGRRKRRFPWFLLILLLASIYLFWILPWQLGPRPVNVEFVDEPATAQ